jgi:hypothetical protein
MKKAQSKVNPDWVDAGPEADIYFFVHPDALATLRIDPPPSDLPAESALG